MKTKNKKAISMRIAAIMTISVFTVLLMAIPGVLANGIPNPTFVTGDVDGDSTTAISIGWSTDIAQTGSHSVHVTTSSVSTRDYAVVGVPTDFELNSSTAISYWGYTVSGSGVNAPDEIFLMLDNNSDGQTDVVLGYTSGLGSAGNWVQFDFNGTTGPLLGWYTVNETGYPILVNIADYYGNKTIYVALGAGSPMSMGKTVDVYLDNLTVNGNTLLDDDTGTIEVRCGTVLGYLACTSIQDGIDAALDGDTIIVHEGTYTITSKLMIDKQGLTITGNVANPENVVVQYNPVANNLIFDMRASDVTVKGIKTTNGKSGFWFDQSGVTGCTISHCIVDTVNEYGIYMKNGGSGHTIEYTTISNTGQTYTGAPAVLIENSLDVTLNGNTLSSISDKGIYVRVCAASNTGERVEVTGNTLSGCNYPCVQVYQSPYTIVDGNTISSTNDKGINIIGPNANSAAERVELTNNIISGCPWGAILVTHDRYTYIHGNTVGPTGDKGITIGNGENVNSNSERIEISGNTVSSTKWPGIQVAWDIDYTYIYNNTLTGCNYFGGDGTGDWDYASIHVAEDCDNTIVDRNDVSDGINGIQTWSDNCEITNNSIYDMGLTYANTKTTADGTYYNSGIIIGSNWLTNNFKPTGTTVTCNNIHDNYWGLYVRDYATLSLGDPIVLSVTAECNWWGDDSGPSGVGPGTGDAVSTNVDFDSWIGITELSGPTDPVQLSNPVNIGLSFACNEGTATLDWDDGTQLTYSENSKTTTESHTYSDAGVYTVTLTIEDCCGRSYSREFRYVVMYDPTAGFVTGGGWINSPAGAYVPDPDAEGKANFGFVSKYKKGQTTPTGNTQFQFKAGNLNFHSDSYDWLVIAGHKAMYKGTGTINGDGNYGFMLSAIDGKLTPSTDDVDKFRIKIWDKDNDDEIVYDNQIGDPDDADLTTAIAGGQIVIHKAK